MFTEQPLAGQIAWLLPLALLSLVALAWRRRPRFQSERKIRSLVIWGVWLLTMGLFFSTADEDAGVERAHPRPREDQRVQSLILWGMWLLTMGIFFSVASFFHEYYLIVMAPAVAALCGIGLVTMWRDYRAGGWRGWLLPVALLLTAAEEIVLLTSYPAWGQWMIPLLTIPCVLVAGALIGTRIVARRAGRAKAVRARVLLAALTVALIALIFAPTVWAAIPILQGTEGDLPLAGPPETSSGEFVQSAGGQSIKGINSTPTSPQRPQGSVDPALVRYLEAHQGHARILVVTDTSADALILATNRPVMPLDGFSSYPLTTSELVSLVTSGTARFFLLGGEGPGNAGNSVHSWVEQHCATVPPKLWQSSSSGSQAGGNGPSLYDCATRH